MDDLKAACGARPSISQDYWGDIKEDWGSGTPVESRGGAPVGSLGNEVPQRGPGAEPR